MFHPPSGAFRDHKKCVVVKDSIRLCGRAPCFKVALADPQHLLPVEATVFKDQPKCLISGFSRH